jgi:hypothetical protein
MKTSLGYLAVDPETKGGRLEQQRKTGLAAYEDSTSDLTSNNDDAEIASCCR